ncbi:MAG TPA: phage holin family protein [Longimicrobiales bacterium]|nr:phage holin family protein [Longimicrobiales bacterium]
MARREGFNGPTSGRDGPSIEEPPTFAWRGGGGGDGGPSLKTLVSRLGQDMSQLAHDEMTLAKLELRSVADALSDDLQTAARTLVKDLAKVGIALSLAVLAGLALTAGAIIGIGALVGAYWAGGLIVGAVLLIAAGLFGTSAARDLRESEAMRLESTRRRAQQNTAVLAAEARETKRFAEQEGREFKRHASPGRTDAATRH